VQKALALGEGGAGVAFFEFANISDPVAFKNLYRQRLDALLVKPDQADRIVAEANTAFGLNINVSARGCCVANPSCSSFIGRRSSTSTTNCRWPTGGRQALRRSLSCTVPSKTAAGRRWCCC
jgi:hypothetical protein